ncbi:class I SAM-dependent methyltransferase [Chloroflexota bacterium]
MDLEKLAYFLFGNNLVIGSHIRKQLDFLREIISPVFQQRQMDDLGCGDGKVTLLLQEIFSPRSLRGFDVNPGLVRRARSRGINAEVRNLSEDIPNGELAVMWGVLHHLGDSTRCLNRMKENYPLVFIREPVRSASIKGLELGHPLRKDEVEQLVAGCLVGAQVHYCGNSIFIFYASPELTTG